MVGPVWNHRRLNILEKELLNRPDPALVQCPSDHNEEEREYETLIRAQIDPNMIAAIELLHFELAAEWGPITEDMGEGGCGEMGGGGRNEERRNDERGRRRGEKEKETGDGKCKEKQIG